MPTPLNPAQYIQLQLSAFANAQTSDQMPMAMDGSQPFSVDAWIKLGGLCANASIFCKDGVFDFGLTGQALHVAIDGYPAVYSDISKNALSEDEWRYVCVTYSGGQVRLFIDGEFNVFQAISGTGQTSANPFQIGHTLQGAARCVRVYNTPLTPDQVMANMYGEPDPATIAAWFDFTQSPPLDKGPHGYPISLKDGATMAAKTPAVSFGGTAYAQPIRDERVNPGGLQVDPYTIQAWVYLNPGELGTQAIFVNSDLETDSGMALYLAPADNGSGYEVKSQRGSNQNAVDTLASTQTVRAGAWANVATTYDGTSLTIYVNGVAVGSGAFGPIPTMQIDSNLLIGAALSHGRPSASTSLQGYISRVDVWSRALSAAEITQYMSALPDLAAANLAAIYEFMSPPARNMISGHPIGLADGAYLDAEVTKLAHGATAKDADAGIDIPEFEQLPADTLAKLRASIDFSALFKSHPDMLKTAKARELAELKAQLSGDALESARAKIGTAWDEAESRMRDAPLDLPFLVTRHVVNNEHVMLWHKGDTSRVIFRAPKAEFDDCTLWRAQLVFIIVGGVIDVMFGVRANLTDNALRYIVGKVLLNPRIASILALGTLMTAGQIFTMGGILYQSGMLKELARLVLNVGFWALLRMLVKLVLKFLLPWAAAADFIASLVATAAIFIATYLSKPSTCDSLPQVDIAGIMFNHSPANTATCALNIRKNYTQQVDVPEWVRKETSPAQAPAAYALKAIAGNTVTIKARFVIGDKTATQMQIQATGGGLLGAIDPVTINFKNSVSDPEWVTLPLNHQTLASAGVARTDTAWVWQYRPVSGGAWTTMQTTHHRIYTVLDVPTAPWKQANFPADTQAPWTDALDFACSWAAGTKTVDTAAAAITLQTNQHLGLTYDMSRGASVYTRADYSISQMVFLGTQFINFLTAGTGNGATINCTDCATIVATFANLVGCDLNESCMRSGFGLNQIIAIGHSAFGYPGFGPAFSYHEVAWTGATSYTDPLYDACLQVDSGPNPWNWGTGITHTPALPVKMVFTTEPISPTLPIPMPFTPASYRERLCSNDAAGIGKCVPTGPSTGTSAGRRAVQ
ncbi:LamG domain-containing protein [uncultured Maricaulis sp.]|uniref:LamG domain-containing protein n=1 Tax=uncultured Maricaulis sp. TaxID=174710 RepID=UPI0030D70C78|tara:strand:- start:66858 stop:70124 length:3267 start_codon:yes stop_codon:yes gene_type:complete